MIFLTAPAFINIQHFSHEFWEFRITLLHSCSGLMSQKFFIVMRTFYALVASFLSKQNL